MFAQTGTPERLVPGLKNAKIWKVRSIDQFGR
jgi:hypothetical protein